MLSTIQELREGGERVMAYGLWANRDKGKRPLMAKRRITPYFNAR
jgi:hypothetical protein